MAPRKPKDDEPTEAPHAAAARAAVEQRPVADDDDAGSVQGAAQPDVGVFVGHGVELHSTADGEWVVDPETGRITAKA